MYKTIVKAKARRGYELLNEGRFEELVSQFSAHVHFVFAGDHALALDYLAARGVSEATAAPTG